MVVAEPVEATEAEVEEGPIEGPLAAPELVEDRLQVMGEPLHLVEPEHRGGALEGVDQAESLADRSLVLGSLLQAQEPIVERGDLLVGLVKVERQHARQVESGHRGGPPSSGRAPVEPGLLAIERPEHVVHALGGTDDQVTPPDHRVQQVADDPLFGLGIKINQHILEKYAIERFLPDGVEQVMALPGGERTDLGLQGPAGRRRRGRSWPCGPRGRSTGGRGPRSSRRARNRGQRR